MFPLEITLSLLIMGLAWASVIEAAALARFKARFTEVWTQMGPGKYEATERIALGTPAGEAPADEQRNLSRYVASRRFAGETLVLSGDIPGIRGYEIGFYPALAQDGAVVLWLCGNARPPQGWVARAPAVTSNLPDRLLPSQCRARSGS